MPGLVLVVDDEVGVRHFICDVLEAEGYEVATAQNGKKAVEIIESRPVDLVITDLAMPEQDGLEMIRLLRANKLPVKIIAMSGQFGGPLLHVAEILGAKATLGKPFSADELVQTVRHVLTGA